MKIRVFLSCVFLSCVLVLSVTQTAWAKMGDMLNISTKTASLLASPVLTASLLSRLKRGDEVVELERQGAWLLVAEPESGVRGWLRASTAVHEVLNTHNRVKKTRSVRSYPSRLITLKELGLADGVLFEGSSQGHTHNFFFNVPLDSKVRSGSFRLLYRASNILNKLSNITIAVNGRMLKQVNISQDGNVHQVDIVLPLSGFKDGLAKVSVRSALLVSEDRCLDTRIGSGVFLQILPESFLKLTYNPVARSIRDAWRMLPQHVVITLPSGRLTPKQFASALSLSDLLMRRGKKLEFKRMPVLGDIILDSKKNIEAVVARKNLRISKGKTTSNHGKLFEYVDNISLIHLGQRALIAITDPFDVQPVYLLDDEWKLVGADSHYQMFKPAYFRSYANAHDVKDGADYYSVPLSKLGLDTGSQYISRETNWSFVTNPHEYPVGTRPDFLNLNIIAPVRWEKDPTYEMYVFLNDVMVRSARLENTGIRQHFTIDLPVAYQKQFNHIRIVMQHDIEEGDCRGVMPHDFIQVAPDSNLVVSKQEAEPKKFADLALYLAEGFDTYLESSYLDHPEVALHWLARLSTDFPLWIDYSHLNFIHKNEVLDPGRSFVALGHFMLGENVSAPIRFDKGRVEIVDKEGASFFDVNHLPKLTVAEIVHSSSAYGLWVTPFKDSSLPDVDVLKLSEDDVAFIDHNGILMTMDSTQPTLAKVYYPEVTDWFALMDQYRFWLIVLGWFLFSMLLVYLYRMTRRHKPAKQDEKDDAGQADQQL